MLAINNSFKKLALTMLLSLTIMMPSFASWDVDTFKENVRTYTRNIVKHREMDLVQEKRDILWDLLTSENREVFEAKYDSIAFAISAAQTPIIKEISKAPKDQRQAVVDKWETERRELADLKEKARLVSEDFYKALAIEFNTGKRPEPKFSFEIEASPKATAADKFDPNTFIGQINIFVNALLKGQEIDTVAYKKSILWDLLTTQNYEVFDKKYSELQYVLSANKFLLNQQVLASKTKEQYAAAMTRLKELEDMVTKAKLVSDDYFKFYVRELRRGRKPEFKFSFEITPISWQLPKESAATQAFAGDWEEARQVLDAALAALKSKNQAQFAKLWSKASEKTAVTSAYDKAQKFYANNGNYDVLPYYMMPNLYVYVERFEDKEIMTVGVRLWGEKRINTKSVYLIKENGEYKIQDWWVG